MTELGDKCDAALQEIYGRTFERADAEAVLADLARHIGCERLELDEQGVAEITVDGDVDVMLLHLPHLPGLVAAAVVAEDAADGGALARRLLQANMSWAVTHGGTFAMLPGRPEVMLCRLVALAGRDVAGLDRELATFVDLVRVWRDEIEEDLEDAEPPEIKGPDVPRDFIRA